MAQTFEPIASQKLNASASSITFNSIPGTYTDLRIVFTDISDSGNTQYIRLNGDTATNYSFLYATGYGIGINGGMSNNSTYVPIGSYVTGASSTYPWIQIIDIFNYTGSQNKSFLIKNSWTDPSNVENTTTIGMWRSSSAVTSLTLSRTGANYLATSMATLYGILKA